MTTVVDNNVEWAEFSGHFFQKGNASFLTSDADVNAFGIRDL